MVYKLDLKLEAKWFAINVVEYTNSHQGSIEVEIDYFLPRHVSLHFRDSPENLKKKNRKLKPKKK